MKQLIIAAVGIAASVAFANPTTNSTDKRVLIGKSMSDRLERMKLRFRETAVKAQTDLELRKRAIQRAQEAAEKKYNCIIHENVDNKLRPLSWSAGNGKSIIFCSDELGGNYIKIDEHGLIKTIEADFNKIPELAYRESITSAMLIQVKSDPSEVASARKKAEDEFDKQMKDADTRSKANRNKVKQTNAAARSPSCRRSFIILSPLMPPA